MTEPTTAAGRQHKAELGRITMLPLDFFDDAILAIEAEAEKKATNGEGDVWHYCDFDSPHHFEARQQDGSALRAALERRLSSGSWDHKVKAAYEWGFLDCAALAALPPSAPPALDVERIAALAVRLANHGESPPPNDPCESCALATTEVVARLQEPDR